MAPNPAVEIKDGSAAYVTAVGGVDVTPAATVVIRLASTTDVDAWSIECITTDNSSSAATVSASLVIDSTLRTATFTAPAAGKTYRFRSRVNSGIDRNGVAQTSYSTTFCLYTVKNGRRKWAADETTEGDSTFGYITQFNDLIDSVPSGSGAWGTGTPGGSDGHVQYNDGGAFGGDAGFRYDDATKVLTVAGAVIGGTAVFTGLDMVANGLSDHKEALAIRRLTTADAAVTNIFAWRPTDEAITSVFVEVNAVASGGAGAGSYGRAVAVKMDGGVGTSSAIESTYSQEFTHSGVGFTGIAVGSGIWIGVSGATGFVNVKGSPTGQIKWGATVTLQTTSWA